MKEYLLTAIRRKDLLIAIVVSVVASASFVGILATQNSYNTTSDENFLKMKGHLTLVLTDQFGNVKDYREIDNLIVKVGQDLVGRLVFNGNTTLTSPTFANFVAIGTGSTAPVLTETALVTPCGTRVQDTLVITNRQGTGATSKVTADATFAAGNCTGNVQEAGLFDALTVGNMFARQQFAGINKLAGDSLTVTWEITLT